MRLPAGLPTKRLLLGTTSRRSHNKKRCLLNVTKKKRARKNLANELTNAVNVALLLISIDCIQILRELSISGQDQEQVPWEYPRRAEATLNAFKAMYEDLKLKNTARKKFKRFPSMLKNISILEDFKLEYRVRNGGREDVSMLDLKQGIPSWIDPKASPKIDQRVFIQQTLNILP